MASIGPPIDQSTFDQIVKENIEDLDMEPEESVQDAIDSLTSQKANMIFIVKEAIILDSEHPGFGKHKCLYLTEELGKLVESDSNLLNDEEKVKQIIEISKELTQELSTDKLPKRYHSCKNGKLHMKLELIYFKIAETLSSDNSTLNLELINSLLNLSINTFQFQPDFVTRQTTTDLCRIMPALEDENLLKILKLISVMSKQHEENRTYFFHGGLFPNVGKLFARDSLSKSQSIDTHNKILAQLCTTIRNFTVDDDPRQTTCRAHDNARDLVNDEAALENLCKFLKNIDDNSYKLKKEVILTLSKLLVRNEFCLKAAEDNCGLLKLITENLEICLKIDENSNNKEQGDTATSAVAATETVSETVLLRPLLLLLKTMCGNDEVKHRVTQSENLIRNIVANIGKWMAVSSIVDAGLTCCHVLALRQPTTCELLSKLNTTSLTLNAMQLHHQDRKVILNGCNLIRNMVARTRHLQKEFIELDVESLLNKVVDEYGKDLNVYQAARAAQRDLDLDAGLKEQWTGAPGLSHEIRRDD